MRKLKALSRRSCQILVTSKNDFRKYSVKVVSISLTLVAKFISQSEQAQSLVPNHTIYQNISEILTYRDDFKIEQESTILPELEIIFNTLRIEESDPETYKAAEQICVALYEEILGTVAINFYPNFLDSRDQEYCTNLMLLLGMLFTNNHSLVYTIEQEPEMYKYLITPINHKFFEVEDLLSNFLNARISVISQIVYSQNSQEHIFKLMSYELLQFFAEILEISICDQIPEPEIEKAEGILCGLQAEVLYAFGCILFSNQKTKEHVSLIP